MRAQARIDNGRLRLRSRRGVDWTLQFPDLSDLPPSDGIGRCFSTVSSSVSTRRDTRLRSAAKAAHARPHPFPTGRSQHRGGPDRLRRAAPDGHAPRRLPYRRRRELLDELALESEHWKTPPAYPAGRDDLAAVTRAHGLEGVVAKRYSAPYMEGRRAPGAWRSSNTAASKR